jgi:hypothetical protein
MNLPTITLTDAVLAASCYLLFRTIKRADYLPAVKLKGCQQLGPIAFPRGKTTSPHVLLNCSTFNAFMDSIHQFEKDSR